MNRAGTADAGWTEAEPEDSRGEMDLKPGFLDGASLLADSAEIVCELVDAEGVGGVGVEDGRLEEADWNRSATRWRRS